MKVQLTYHASVERRERIIKIEKTIGFGKPIASAILTSQQSTKPSKNVLTDTGVIIVYSLETGKVVTVFVGNVHQSTTIYKKCYNVNRCPSHIMKMINNAQFYKEQIQ